MTNLSRLIDRLQGVREDSGGWRALCPAHPDRQPSLKIDLGQDGAILVHCHAGCKLDDILDKVGLTQADLFDDGVPTGKGRTRKKTTEGLSEEDRNFRHMVYAHLLQGLPLEHTKELLDRGLRSKDIDRNGYASLVQPPRDTLVSVLFKVHGEKLFTVPGFFFFAPTGRVQMTVRTGLLIPVRDIHGRIQALEVRTGEPGAKYRWLSSPHASSGTPVHVPLGRPMLIDTLRITEGPLKADVATALDQTSLHTIGLASVSNWREAFPVLEQLKPRAIRLAFDSDWREKPQVEEQLALFAAALLAEGYEVSYEQWEGPKGIDDLLLAGGRPREVSAGYSLPGQLAATPPDQPPSPPSGGKEAGYPPTPEIPGERNLVVVPGDAPIGHTSWLWPGWLPKGHLVILDGDPGTGKSLFTVSLMSSLMQGLEVTGGVHTVDSAINVLMLAGEDSVTETLLPRLRATGIHVADLKRFHVVKGIKNSHGREVYPLSLPKDLHYLQSLIRRHQAGLVVMDPMFNFIDQKYDANSDQAMKHVLSHLARMAEETHCAILGVRHLNKKVDLGGLYRGTGSIGVIGTARVGWMLLEDPTSPSERLLVQTKNNLAAKQPTWRLRVAEEMLGPVKTVRMVFDREDPRGLSQVLSRRKPPVTQAEEKKEQPPPPTKTDTACEVWKQLLANGPAKRQDVTKAMTAAKIGWDAKKRGKERLGIDYDDKTQTFFYLPGRENGKPADQNGSGGGAGGEPPADSTTGK